ncbi:MAG TPA: hypothetical protein VMM18_12380 [Gemmatimonadaceae bacterium]|nr:hypothetical protein [Gemmatimonadaceae bacterium]
MRVLALVLVLLGACRPQAGSDVAGAPTPAAAVEAFLAAARAQDLDAMALMWGNSRGLVRDQIPREERERRQLVMMCYMSHDSFRILDEGSGDTERPLRVELTRGQRRLATTFVTVRTAAGRWLVQNAELQPLTEFCRNPPRGTS